MPAPLRKRYVFLVALMVLGSALCGCSNLPSSGPTADDVQASQVPAAAAGVQVVDVNDRVARQLMSGRRFKLFSETMSSAVEVAQTIGSGDTLEVNIWEAPPATLFGAGAVDPRTPSTTRPSTLPEQMVDRDGLISVPFAGRIRAAGRTVQQIEAEIAGKLKNKANQPEVLVRQVRNASATVTVVGEVSNSVRMPLTPGGERLLDALAAAGGVRQPISKTTLQLTRGERYQALPLDVVIRDPRQNIRLQPGDVVTAIFQPLSFTALGATGRNEEINFEAQGITLAQALARAGGLQDSRSDPQGVFIFRLEQPDAVDWPRPPEVSTPDGLVPVVYRLNLRDPKSFFVMQGFPINNKDILYVSNASASELQKFLNLVFSVVYPVINLQQATR